MTPTDGFDEETTLGDILSAGPQSTIEKGVTKSPTRKALQQAAQRKEADAFESAELRRLQAVHFRAYLAARALNRRAQRPVCCQWVLKVKPDPW